MGKVSAYLGNLLWELRNCRVIPYIKINKLNENVVFTTRESRILNLKGSVLDIDPSAQISCAGTLMLGSDRPAGLKAGTLLKMGKGSKLTVNGHFKAFYNSEICVFPGASLELGTGYINAGTQLRCQQHITVGSGCAIGRNVMIMDFDAHSITYEDGGKNKITAPVTIGEHVWIGAGATILKGVTIGDGAVIGAGSVVTHDIPANTAAAGNPARVIRNNIRWE